MKKNESYYQLDLVVDYLEEVNYALVQSRLDICKWCVVENGSDHEIENLQLIVSGDYLETFTSPFYYVGARQKVRISDIFLRMKVKELACLTERVLSNLVIKVVVGEQIVYEDALPISLMAYDQWIGERYPQTLASFVTPNHPCIAGVIRRASEYLKGINGDASFSNYMNEDPGVVREQIEAIFDAVKDEKIVYSVMPPSYEDEGQRVRLADKVVVEKIGNCLDLSLLFAACMEYVGINPVLVLVPGHAFVGAWLVPDSHSRSVDDDASFLLNRCAKGMEYMLFFEATDVTQMHDVSFATAVEHGEHNLHVYADSLSFVDIYRCRIEDYRPLPQLIHEQENWRLSMPEEVPVAEEGSLCMVQYGMKDKEEERRRITKMQLWERKLLDFSVGNNSLLNVQLRSALQLVSVDAADLAQQLYREHRSFCIEEKVDGMVGLDVTDVADVADVDAIFDSMQLDNSVLAVIRDDLKAKRLHTFHTQLNTHDKLKKMQRDARTLMEENGANLLFLSFGMLRWLDKETKEVRMAPILLVPVEINYRNSVFRMKSNGEDVMLNVTLFEYLCQTFEMDFPGLEDLLADDTSFDVQQVFAIVRSGLVRQAGWSVAEECVLGIFSFSKFMMWNDLHRNAEVICENPIVYPLVNPEVVFRAERDEVRPEDLDVEVSPSDLCLPLSYDSSQLCAVMEAMRGNSFILHGPPGTGKSQTITNLITSALYKGKRVLFVAEKMAALSVVQSRLEKLGLGVFCLELHSNKSTKQHVLKQLDEALNIPKEKEIDSFEESARQLFEQRKELVAYVEALHGRASNLDFSLYECIQHYYRFKTDDFADLVYEVDEEPAITPQNLGDYEYYVDRLAAMIQLVGAPCHHPLRELTPNVQTMAHVADLRSALSDGLEVLEVLSQWNRSQNLSLGDFSKRLASLIHFDSLLKQVLKGASRDLLQVDARSWQQDFERMKDSCVFTLPFRRSALLQKVRVYVPQLAKEELEGFMTSFLSLMLDPEMVPFHALLDHQEEFDVVLAAAHRWEVMLQKLSYVDLDGFHAIPLHEAGAIFTRWLTHLHLLKDWKQWCLMREDLRQKHMGGIVEVLERQVVPLPALKRVFFMRYFQTKATERIAAVPALDLFNGLLFDEKIEHYRDLNARFQEIENRLLYVLLTQRVCKARNNIQLGDQLRTLRHNVSSRGRGTSIRHLFDQIPDLLACCCPCMLMSPMSVAQYLDVHGKKFDLVIFDEASQIPTCEAVGAIARGNQLVVAGDTQQMPPTTFFKNTRVLEDEYELDDLESILEDCYSLKLPSVLLSWHYRSKHESLIAFSNNEYYDNQLNTFPAVDDQQRRATYVAVKGVYQKGTSRRNKEEALAVVDEIERRLQDENLRKRSIGVISFNKQQQYLIEDLLEARMESNKKLRKWADECGESIFIKNLENVQGDERDVILFSVGYGPDKQGKVSMNFGPLNLEGGERRLNVAVTRSRYEMVVFSSLHASDIDLRRTNALGVVGLKRFLDYVEHGTFIQRARLTQDVQPEGLLTQQLASELRRKGLQVQTYVGKSHFKIHIGVMDPEDESKYLLGILLDDQLYRDTPTMCDREIVRPTLLKSLGWHLMHVWTVDWFERPQYVIDTILREVAGLKEADNPKEKE